jgi:replicative DNA helicase
MALVHLGAAALKKGKTVIHYTLELGDTVVAGRYDSCLTGVPLDLLMQSKEQIYDEIQEVEGSLIVKEYPTKSASTRTLMNHLEKLKVRGIVPDMIIVDYGDLLRPISSQKEKRNELESIYEEMRGLAQHNECCIWTASQTNRSGLNAEVITMEAISEAFNKCFVADFICTISRTVEDKQNNLGRMFVAKNRNGPDGIVFPLKMDTSRVLIEVAESGGVEQAVVTTTRDQMDVLREKYTKFVKDKNQRKEESK